MIVEILIVTILVVWFVASVIYQCFPQQLQPLTARYDRFRFLVSWTFFSSGPRNFEFESRHEFHDGSTDDWHVTWRPAPRPWAAALWNPAFIFEDVTYKWMVRIVDFVESAIPGQGAVEDQFPYRSIAAHFRQISPGDAVRGQFRIVERTSADAEDRVYFVSPLMKLVATQANSQPNHLAKAA